MSAVPDLLYSEVSEDLRASVAGLLADQVRAEALLTLADGPPSYDARLWRSMAVDVGVAGLGVPAEYGGNGGSATDTAVVLEELGRTLAPVPVLGSTVLATSALLGACPGDDAEHLLAQLASGALTAALIVTASTGPSAGFPGAVQADGPSTLTGVISTVVDVDAADVFVVPAIVGGSPALFAVQADAPGLGITRAVSLDVTRPVADIALSSTPARRLAVGDAAVAGLRHSKTAGAALLSSEQLGIAGWCLDASVSYTSERHQFGRPVGSFQALKHRLADLYVELVTARAAARNAAAVLADPAAAPSERELAACTAQAYCAGVAVHAAEECIQMHGGIGMTWEHPAHLYLKRAKADQLVLGTPGEHRARLAQLIPLAISA